MAEDGQPKTAALAWIAMPAVGGPIAAHLLLDGPECPWLRAAGVFALAWACIFMFAPFFLLTRHGDVKKGQDYMDTATVVDRGLYAVVRHPQYLGYMLLATGFALLSQTWAAVLLAAVAIALLYATAVQEEKACRTKLGNAYQEYTARTPRFNAVGGFTRMLRRRGRDRRTTCEDA